MAHSSNRLPLLQFGAGNSSDSLSKLASRNPKFIPPKYLSQVKLTPNSFSLTKSSNQFLERLEAENQWLQEQLTAMKAQKFGPLPRKPMIPSRNGQSPASSLLRNHRKLKPLSHTHGLVDDSADTTPQITWRVPTALANRRSDDNVADELEEVDGYTVVKSKVVLPSGDDRSTGRQEWHRLYNDHAVLNGSQSVDSLNAATTGSPSLLHGEFNQAESDQSFQEALMAWRTAGGMQSNTTPENAPASASSQRRSTGVDVTSVSLSSTVESKSLETGGGGSSADSKAAIDRIAGAIQFNNGARSALSYLEQLELQKLRAASASLSDADNNRHCQPQLDSPSTATPMRLDQFSVQYSAAYQTSPLRVAESAVETMHDRSTAAASPSHLFTSPTNLFNQSTIAETMGGFSSLKRSKFMDDILGQVSSPVQGGGDNVFARLKKRKLLPTTANPMVDDYYESDQENHRGLLSEMEDNNSLTVEMADVSDHEDDEGKRLFQELSELNDANRATAFVNNRSANSGAKKRSTALIDFKRPPSEGKYYMATSFDGSKLFYFPRRKAAIELENRLLDTDSHVNPLLPRSILRSSVFRWMDEIEREKLAEAVRESKKLAESRYSQVPGEPEQEDGDSVPKDTRLWAEKYRPKKFIELISDEWLNTEILKWVKQWDKVVFGVEPPKQSQQPQQRNRGFQPSKPAFVDRLGRPDKKILLITGPPGLGKTTLAHAIARQCNYNVVEVNASDERTADVLKNSILHSIESRSVFGDKKPNLIVIDEIDGAMGGQTDTSLIKFLVDLANRGVGKRSKTGFQNEDSEDEGENVLSGNGTTKIQATAAKKKKMPLQRPIICICNDPYVPALRPLRQIAQIYNLRKPEASVLAKRLKSICDTEGLKADMRALITLCEKADCDVRTCLNTLQFLQRKSDDDSKFKITTEEISNTTIGHKDSQKSLFSIWQDIFYTPPSKKNSANFSIFNLVNPVESHGEYDKLLNGCFENYLSMKFREQHGFGSNIVQLQEYLYLYDMLGARMYAGGGGSMAYMPFVFCAFNRLCSHTGNPNLLKLEYPRKDVQVFMNRRANESVISNMLNHVDARVLSWIRTGRSMSLEVLSYLLRIMSPAIRPVNIQLLKVKEKCIVNRLVRIMASFRLTYIQESSTDSSVSGGYSFKLEPPLDQLVKFEDMKEKQTILPQAYTVRQMIAHEIELEILQQKERLIEKRMGKREKNGEDNFAAIMEKPVKDFFGRIIEKSEQMELDEKKAAEVPKVIFKYHEGYSNAVRRPVLMSKLLKRN